MAGLIWLWQGGFVPPTADGSGGGSGKKRPFSWSESPVDYSKLYDDPSVRAARLTMRAAIHAFGSGMLR
jgi:hypothetical protein